VPWVTASHPCITAGHSGTGRVVGRARRLARRHGAEAAARAKHLQRDRCGALGLGLCRVVERALAGWPQLRRRRSTRTHCKPCSTHTCGHCSTCARCAALASPRGTLSRAVCCATQGDPAISGLESIFNNLEVIANFHQIFLLDLKKMPKEPAKVSASVVAHESGVAHTAVLAPCRCS
jgi:hypothetical protein